MRFLSAPLLLLLLWTPAAASAESASADPSSDGSDFAPLNVGSTAPEFSEKDLYGQHDISLSDYRGKVVVLNFWSTGSTRCREEIPTFEALQNKHKDELTVIGVSVFSSSTATQLLYWEYKINYPIIYGSYELMGEYSKVAVIPTTFVIDKDGKVAAELTGPRSEADYEKLVEPLLSK